MDVRVGLWRRLSAEELMLLNCGVVVVNWRLLRVPWTAKGSNQSILKEISPGISLEGMMLKLKLQYFGHLMRRVDWLEKILMLGGIGGRRRRGRQRMRWLDGIADSMDVSLGELQGVGDGQGGLVCCDSWGRKELDTTEQLIWSEGIRASPSAHIDTFLNTEMWYRIHIMWNTHIPMNICMFSSVQFSSVSTPFLPLT